MSKLTAAETRHQQALLERARFARKAIRDYHLEPLLGLSYVVWPTQPILDAQKQRKAA